MVQRSVCCTGSVVAHAVKWTFRVSGSATFAKLRGAGPQGNGATGVTLHRIILHHHKAFQLKRFRFARVAAVVTQAVDDG